MALTKVTSGAVSGLAASATTDTTDASNITTGTIPTARLASTLDLSGKTVTLPAASVTAHATNPTKASIEALGIAASSITGALPAISGANLTGIETVTKSTTAPTSPAQGDMWFNTSTEEVGGIASKCMASYSGTEWLQMSNKFSATGGTESTYSSGGINYKVHTFTSSGTFTPTASGSVDYLVIAGGGGGGHYHYSGGGGAGGYLTGTATVAPGATTVTIGAGGPRQNSALNSGNPGYTSSFGSLVSCVGGGYGAYDSNGGSGGSGGGGASSTTHYGGSATSGQGNVGGTGVGVAAGGGGGAGGPGRGASSASPQSGGAGASSTITGTSVTRAGGGGGAMNANNTYFIALGGSGGGGNAGADYLGPNVNAVDATVNSGSGGGGACWSNNSYGAAGGSGIVIIRYAV